MGKQEVQNNSKITNSCYVQRKGSKFASNEAEEEAVTEMLGEIESDRS